MLLELKELNYKYPGSVGDVFRDLSCRMTEPGFHALFGPSGVGKTIGITFGGNDETIMRALLAKYDIKEDEVKFFSVRYDYTPFYKGVETLLKPVGEKQNA
jgi:ABC-type Mn2+/Zn2+ transport system ATPase subunit